jgi:hypothetical protein
MSKDILDLPYLGVLLTIKFETQEHGLCSLATARDALVTLVGEKGRQSGYIHTMVERMESRGLIARTVDRDLIYINNTQNNTLVAENLRLIRGVTKIAGKA